MFNQDIEKLAEGEDVVKEEETRLINKLREEFINWALVLKASIQDGKSGAGLPYRQCLTPQGQKLLPAQEK